MVTSLYWLSSLISSPMASHSASHCQACLEYVMYAVHFHKNCSVFWLATISWLLIWSWTLNTFFGPAPSVNLNSRIWWNTESRRKRLQAHCLDEVWILLTPRSAPSEAVMPTFSYKPFFTAVKCSVLMGPTADILLFWWEVVGEFQRKSKAVFQTEFR